MGLSYFAFPTGENVLFEPWLTGPLVGVLISLVVFELTLKGWALWRAARLGRNVCFIAILVINTIGILPLLFLLATSKEYEMLQAAPPKDIKKKKK